MVRGSDLGGEVWVSSFTWTRSGSSPPCGDELLKDDERAQEERRRSEEHAERVKRQRDVEYRDKRRDVEGEGT